MRIPRVRGRPPDDGRGRDQRRTAPSRADGVAAVLAEAHQALTSHRDLLGRHGQLVAQHAELLARHSEILDVLRARLGSEDPELTHADFLVHYELAGRLKALFTERLPGLSDIRAQHEREQGGDTDPLLREAELVREMCLALFGQQEPDFTKLAAIATSDGRLVLAEQDSRLLSRIQREAAELRAAVTSTGHRVSFTFELPPGTVADPDRHELWTSSIAGDPVAFVVTPGYEASGRRIMPPGVITVRISAGA